MKLIALVDTVWEGHHPTYLKVFAKTLLESGHEVVALCPEPKEMSGWIATACPNHQARFHARTLREIPPSRLAVRRLRPAANALRSWLHLRKAIRALGSELGRLPDLTFLAWLDSYLPYMHPVVIDRVFPHAWSGLYFHPRHLRRPLRYQHLRKGPFDPTIALTSGRCPAVAVLDEGVVHQLHELIRKPVVVFPDIIDESLPAAAGDFVETIRTNAAGRPIVGLLGALERRKGLLTLLEASKRLTDEWLFVFGGPLFEPDFTAGELSLIRTMAVADGGNCFFYLHRLTEPQFNSMVQACDVIFAAYEGFLTSSNLLTKAAVFEKPVIVSTNCCMGERVKRFRLGHTIHAGDVDQCVDILRMLHDQLSSGKRGVVADYEGYRRMHSADRLPLAFADILNPLC
jgi:glycosyltransferase involved in cell wall biosynthesis